jgi:hypothetical protein
MQLFQDLLDRSKQLNQAPPQPTALHAQQGRYKIIHQAIKIPNLPAPLHYLNFYSLIGQPSASIFQQPHLNIRKPLNVATVLASSSMHSVGNLHAYDIAQDCLFKGQHFQFTEREQLFGLWPNLYLQRQNDELSFQIEIQALDLVSYFYQLRWSLGQYWSVPCQCQGEIIYKKQKYKIDQLGVFEYGRTIDFNFLPFAFYSYQLIPLSDTQQLIILQLRNQFNSILYSRLYLKNIATAQVQLYDQSLDFQVQRFYPLVKTPNDQHMYLPRMFSWSLQQDNIQICIQAESRGDFKFGLGAGFVGSFCYQVTMNRQSFSGEHGYCEYIDCRSLKYQELKEAEKNNCDLTNPALIMLKNR